jgi:LacI family transcriptional regulator
MRRSTAPTLQDVAREAGVSAMAVSVVLNGARSGSRVSAATRQRIVEAAERLAYRPNAAARGLQRRRMDALGVVARFDGGGVNTYLLDVLSGILEACAARGQSTTVLSVSDWGDERRVLGLCDGRVDGMILIAPGLTDGFAATLQRHAPFVAIHADAAPPSVWGLDVENERGAYLATRHLIEHGHRRILYLAGPLEQQGPQQRLAGHRRALEEFGIAYDPALVHEVWFDAYHAHQLTLRLLDGGLVGPLPTALFGANDAIAAGAMEALSERGLRVPDDVSVVGFDDAPESRMTTPRLTTIRQPFRELGGRAVDLLLEQIEADADNSTGGGAWSSVQKSDKLALTAGTPPPLSPLPAPRTEVLDVELVVRASVGPPPSAPPSPITRP